MTQASFFGCMGSFACQGRLSDSLVMVVFLRTSVKGFGLDPKVDWARIALCKGHLWTLFIGDPNLAPTLGLKPESLESACSS